MEKKHKVLAGLIAAGILVGGGVGYFIQNNQPAPRTDPISQEPIKAAPIGVQATVIIEGQFMADFKELTATGNIVVNDVAYPVEYTDEFGKNYAVRGVKYAENGEYKFTSEPAETAFDINEVVTSKEKEVVSVSNSVQPFVTYSGTFDDDSFFTKSASGKILNGKYGGSEIVRGEGNTFTVRAPARYLAAYEFNVNHDDKGLLTFAGATNGKLTFPNTASKLVDVGIISVIPAQN
jgi:hypothetical protein